MRFFRIRQLTLVVFASTCSLTTAAVQKPVVDRPFRHEERGGVGSLEALWSISDLIVEGVVGNDRPADYGTAPVRVNTMFDVHISEVFKGSRTPGTKTVIQVRRSGGRRDEGDKVVNHVQDGYPLFQRGERYILFLTRHEWVPPAKHTGIYYADATKTSDSAFRIGADLKVAGTGKSGLSQSLRSTPLEILRRNLRAMAGRK